MDARAAEESKAGGCCSQCGCWQLSEQHVQEMRRALQEQQSAVRQLFADWTEQLECRRQPAQPSEKDGARASAIETMPPILEAEGACQQGSPHESPIDSEDPAPLANLRDDVALPCSVEEVNDMERTLNLSEQHGTTLPLQKDAGDQDPIKDSGDPAGQPREVPGGVMRNTLMPRLSSRSSSGSEEVKLSNILEDFRRNLGNVGKAFEKSFSSLTGKGTLKWTGTMKGGLSKFVYSMKFRMLTTFVIGLNAFTIGYEVDESLQRGYAQSTTTAGNVLNNKPGHWRTIEVCFVVYFAVEIILRVAAERLMFFFGKEKLWNLFDLFLVLSSFVGIAMSGGDYADFSFARILRLIRISRVLRILRAMRFSESLRVMVFSIMSSLMSLFWVLCLMFFVIYFFTILFLTAITDAVTNDPTLDVGPFTPSYKSLVETVLHMFMSISGGIDWETMVNPLRGLDPTYVAIFVLYIFFMAFGVLNVVVGIFVENAKQQQEKDREIVTKTGLKQERENIKRMRDIFREADKDGDDTLSWEEFQEYLQDSEVATFFSALGLDVSVAQALFVLLDVDSSNAVNIDEFVQGCLRLKGSARSIDVNMLLYENEKLNHQLEEFMETMDFKMSQLGRELKMPHISELEQALRPNKRNRSPRLASILLTPDMSASLAGPSPATASAATRRAGASTSPSALKYSPTTESLDMRLPGSLGGHTTDMST